MAWQPIYSRDNSGRGHGHSNAFTIPVTLEVSVTYPNPSALQCSQCGDTSVRSVTKFDNPVRDSAGVIVASHYFYCGACMTPTVFIPKGPEKPYIRTFTGKKVNPLDMKVEDIDIRDIARALALENRFNGHTPFPYSVAQHCVLASWDVQSQDERKHLLLHDASEAYLKDVPRLLKQDATFAEYRKIEERLDRVIAERFGLQYPHPPYVKEIDNRLLAREIQVLLSADEPLPYEPLATPISDWGWETAEREFLLYAEHYGIS